MKVVARQYLLGPWSNHQPADHSGGDESSSVSSQWLGDLCYHARLHGQL